MFSSKKYSKVSGLAHTTESESIWHKRKPTHLPPLRAPSPSPTPDHSPLTTFHRHGSVLSIAPSIVSNAPSTASESSTSGRSFDPHAKLEHLRRRLGEELPASAAFHSTCPGTAVPRTPQTAVPTTSSLAPKRSPRGRTHTPRPSRNRPKYVCQAGPLPPLPPVPAHTSSSRSRDEDESAGLVRPRVQLAAGSRIGGADFKAARRAKRERVPYGTAGIGGMIEMVGFL